MVSNILPYFFGLSPFATSDDECGDCEGKVTDLKLNWDWHNDYRIRDYKSYENTCYTAKPLIK